MKRIYLDNAATTPVDSRVISAMKPYFSHFFGNPSSIHSFGQEARSAIDIARRSIADFLHCKPTEIIFTSGGSESDNLALRGLVEAWRSESKNYKPHLITSDFEHHAVRDTVRDLADKGLIEATFIKPNSEGLIEVERVREAIQENTAFISIIYVNNEIGTVQPIREIGKMIEKENKNRKVRIYFHTDAVQAAEYFQMNVDYLHVDLLSMSAHKIYGPKGVGLLYVRSGTPIKRQIIGGGQEYNKRAGTENVPGIIGFAKAIELIDQYEGKRLLPLRERLIDGLLAIPDSRLNGSRELRSPANVNVSFYNAEGESILLNLDLEGIAASTGSACTSGSLEPSHVLLAIGLPPEWCHGSVRFTLGRQTTEAEIDRAVTVTSRIVNKLRQMSPL